MKFGLFWMTCTLAGAGLFLSSCAGSGGSGKTPDNSSESSIPKISVKKVEGSIADQAKPIQIPGQTKAITLPGQAKPIQIPGQTKAITLPGQAKPIQIPGQTKAITLPGQAKPIQIPGQTKAITLPGQAKPIQIPGQTSAIKLPGQAKTIQLPGQNSGSSAASISIPSRSNSPKSGSDKLKRRLTIRKREATAVQPFPEIKKDEAPIPSNLSKRKKLQLEKSRQRRKTISELILRVRKPGGAQNPNDSENSDNVIPVAYQRGNQGLLFNRDNLDKENPGLDKLQSPAVALADFPLDRYRKVDWVAAIQNGHIQPRTDLNGENKPMQTRDTEILMTSTRNMPHVLFPHLPHTQWLDCSNCHPDPFVDVENGNNYTMDEILRGKGCGQCHGRVAFSLMVCERCHSVPHKDSPSQWWRAE